MKTLTCKNCGGALPIENQFVRTITCKFCDTVFLVSGTDTLDETGKTASLANFPSRLRIGNRGEIRGRGFNVLGRVRYVYDEGYWEEWQIAWDDGAPPDWLEEDEGYWTVYRRERVKSAIPLYDQVRVGMTIPINNRQVFITEKRTAKVGGTEGQFAAVLPLKGAFGYLQGGADGVSVGVNYWEDEIELSIGDDLEHHDLKLQ
jgi:hypothetical protein